VEAALLEVAASVKGDSLNAMTDTPWTKGPWRLLPMTMAVRSKDGSFVAHDIARLPDARLIVKAPEMVELLERWATWPSSDEGRFQILAATETLLSYIKGDPE